MHDQNFCLFGELKPIPKFIFLLDCLLAPKSIHILLNVPSLHHTGFCLKGVEPELVKTHLVGYLDVKESPADDV